MNARHWPVQKPNGQWTHAIGQFKNPTANECTPLASSKTQQPIKAWPIWCRSNKVQDIGLFKNPTANQCPHTLRLSDKAHVIGLLKYEQPLTWWRFNKVSVPTPSLAGSKPQQPISARSPGVAPTKPRLQSRHWPAPVTSRGRAWRSSTATGRGSRWGSVAGRTSLGVSPCAHPPGGLGIGAVVRIRRNDK